MVAPLIHYKLASKYISQTKIHAFIALKWSWIYSIMEYFIQFLFHFRDRRQLFLFHGVSFAQEILKELILLCMDYDIVLRL